MTNGLLNDLITSARQSIIDSNRRQFLHEGTLHQSFDPESHFARFELYHAAMSLCSQKVRLTLAELGQSYVSMEMNLMPLPGRGPENYNPNYINLRIAATNHADYVSGFTGQSSVQSEGFDPAVVPTLIDHEKKIVIIDSANICEYLCREISKPNLRPENLEGEIIEQTHIVDKTPHVALLYGRNPEGDKRPEDFLKKMDVVHDHKLQFLRAEQARVEKNSELFRAYSAKIKKEERAKEFVQSKDSMMSCLHKTRDLLQSLESKLGQQTMKFLLSNEVTLADLVWAVSLFRLNTLALEDASRYPNIVAYGNRLFHRASFQHAIRQWPGAIVH